jgi:hypothetical protein
MSGRSLRFVSEAGRLKRSPCRVRSAGFDLRLAGTAGSREASERVTPDRAVRASGGQPKGRRLEGCVHLGRSFEPCVNRCREIAPTLVVVQRVSLRAAGAPPAICCGAAARTARPRSRIRRRNREV